MNGLAELFYTTGKDNPWTMTRYNQWYRIISTAMGKITPTARRTSSSTKDLGKNTHLYAGVDNIFDKHFSNDDNFSICGRIWRAGVELTF